LPAGLYEITILISLAKFLKAQQLMLNMKYLIFQWPAGLQLNIFSCPGQILMMLGYWAPVKLYL